MRKLLTPAWFRQAFRTLRYYLPAEELMFSFNLPIQSTGGIYRLTPDRIQGLHSKMTDLDETTMKTAAVSAFKLPPLILHPFSTSEDQGSLLESSRASLELQGFTPRGQASIEDLDRLLLHGRYAELRMLFYIGKDLTRWIEQCAEVGSDSSHFAGRRLRPESFALLLVQHIPAHVKLKLEGWGVLDFCSLFRRAFGLHAVIGELPPRTMFSTEFLRRYHRYLDQWYEQWLRNWPFDQLTPDEVAFDLYASGEYSTMLAQSWAEDNLLQ